ncbi:hypothetical protein J5N97_019765 [Dioscorea zingiberensis]|uniref:Protein ABIL5 n=1 Tax=Dioscorea zingiberensis TaxID=325984 RepID=A0A9D5HCL1_9LILI|nr:hypothetical protein J5N97_019765 [Dioscorea zingiberensis]
MEKGKETNNNNSNNKELKHNETDHLKISLQELKDLRSQLHNAADYCEALFLKAKQKKIVMENTKSYLCQAIVTVIDHVGTVSSKLEQRLHENNEVPQIEQRIDCLKQRVLTCQQYAVGFDLSTFRWSSELKRHYYHYTTSSSLQKDGTDIKATVTPSEQDHSAIVIGQLNCDSDGRINAPSIDFRHGTKLFVAVPLIKGPSILSKPFNPPFGTQTVEAHLVRFSDQKKKHAKKNSFYSALRRSKRQA